MLPRLLFCSLTFGAVFVAALTLLLQLSGPAQVTADVGGVSANAPTFTKGQQLTITVNAEDDDGPLTIISNLLSSELTVLGCSGLGSNRVLGKCDSTGIAAVSGQGTTYVSIDTNALDSDVISELLTVTLTLVASCNVATVVTVSATQPGNVGPDDVTVNCVPPTPTPTPTLTPTPTATPTPLPTQTPTPVPPPPPPPLPPRSLESSVLSAPPSAPIVPPNTGDAGLIH